MDEFQKNIVEKLAVHTKVWVVGGAVRNQLLGIESPDVDLVCFLPPERIKACFLDEGYTVQTIGKNFSTISVFKDKLKIDIIQIDDLEQDAQRRDFTINAIYQDPITGEIVDPMNGKKDLVEGKLKTCGIPDEQFRDDPIRILRMVKFAVKFAMKIDPDTWDAAKERLSLLSRTAKERITAELAAILILPDAEKAVRMLDELGYWHFYFPELSRLKGLEQNQYHSLDVWEHTMAVFRNTPEDLYLRLASLFHDIGKWEVASRECYVNGILKYENQSYWVDGFKINPNRGNKELDHKLKRLIGKKVRLLAARLDHYPEIIQFKKVLEGEPSDHGLTYVENGKRQFLNHEVASSKMLADILKRYPFSMFFSGNGQKREKELLKLVGNHMAATLLFMPEFRGEPAKRPLQRRAADLVWSLCWDGRAFKLTNIHDFLILWKADYQAGKVHTAAQNTIFEKIFKELIATAIWQKENLPKIDWNILEKYTDDLALSRKDFGRYKDLVRDKAMREMRMELTNTFLKKVYWEYTNL
ncbi:CCA tRNA nucleotidyltransferase [Dehalobacter sp. DCM]|uniref:CCA tRNA nucleotidyltransferase n=1 Tax=Dehalobacter sp. DCM TaxID=2907827 RepID=UPI003081F884|nr:CCA tRNA nucleotidyltransferase [Dehalobacter sp. DCM]